jgi:hypothetical protein
MRAIPIAIFTAFLLTGTPALALCPAYGFGGAATGGKGGTFVHVTSLGDNAGTCPHASSCTLRTAVATANSYVVFDVSGTIVLGQLLQPAANVTIDGSTAPGDGIWISNSDGAGRLRILNDNVVVTHLRFRPAIQQNSNSKCIEITNGENILIDHVSCAWSYDEQIAITAYGSDEIRDVTVQHSIFAEAIKPSSHNVMIEGNTDRVTFYQNLFSSTGDRNVSFTPGNTTPGGPGALECDDQDMECGLYEFVQNYVYNFTYGLRLATESANFAAKFDVIENSFAAGPSRSLAAGEKLPILADNGSGSFYHGAANVQIFQDGNAKDFRADTGSQQCSNFSIWNQNQNECSGCANAPCEWDDYSAASRQIADHPAPPSLSPAQAEEFVLAHAGARFPCLDSEDARILDDAAANTGPGDWISRANFAGSYPTLTSAITSTATSLVLSGVTTESTIPTNIGGGKVKIGSEVMTYDNITGGNTLTGLVRGADGTTAAAHSASDVVYGEPLRALPSSSSPVCP